jgi:hypothetical protein
MEYQGNKTSDFKGQATYCAGSLSSALKAKGKIKLGSEISNAEVKVLQGGFLPC